MTLQEYGQIALNIEPAVNKCHYTRICCQYWTEGFIPLETKVSFEADHFPSIKRTFSNQIIEMRDRDKDRLKRIMKKNGLESTIHGIANAESFAIDLFWDIVCRYEYEQLPMEFYIDMMNILREEVGHFLSWNERLIKLDCPYGCLPITFSLWQSAQDTEGDILARIAVINLTHEAKGLDTYLLTREKLACGSDEESLLILEKNYNEEINHVSKGLKWFRHICQWKRPADHPVDVFHSLSRKHFKGKLRAPFNVQARLQAGMTEDWYLPLT